MLKVGTRVKYSEYACRSLRDAWNMAGSYEGKSRAAGWLKDKQAERGTVVKSGKNDAGYDQLDIQWDNGSLSYTAPGQVVEDVPAPVAEVAEVKQEKPKRKRAPRGCIPKDQQKGLLEQLDSFEKNNIETLMMLKPEFRDWIEAKVAELRESIKAQEPWICVKSNCDHLVRSLKRMRSGEIESITETGGFIINR